MSARRRKTTALANSQRSSRKPFRAAQVEYALGGGPDKRCYRVNCDKIRRALPNFSPQWTAHKGAQELYDAYRAAGLIAGDLLEIPIPGSATFENLCALVGWMGRSVGSNRYLSYLRSQ